MDRHLPKPKDLTTDPSAAEAPRIFKYWLCTIEDYIATLQELRRDADPEINKTRVVRNFLSPEVYSYVEEIQDYDILITTLRQMYIKQKNNVYARHLLVSRKQNSCESVSEYCQALKLLAKDCTFQNVSAVVYKNELIRDSFINGLVSTTIRQRLLEQDEITLQRALEIADGLERAQIQASSMGREANPSLVASVPPSQVNETTLEENKVQLEKAIAATPVDNSSRKTLKKKICYYCGGPMHPRNFCPAQDRTCHTCGKRGHFAKVCRSRDYKAAKISATVQFKKECSLIAGAGAPSCLRRAVVDASIAGHLVKALLDSGASENFIDMSLADQLGLLRENKSSSVTMASTEFNLKTYGRVKTTLKLFDRTYTNMTLDIMKDACADVILGQKFLERHNAVTFKFGGDEEDLVVPDDTKSFISLAAAKIEPPRLFEHLHLYCKPIATRSRSYSKADQDFIESEIQKLLENDIIEPSTSPWRAQILVVRNFSKCRLVIDYSQTINRCTLLDAYPLPKIDDVVNRVAQDCYYSTLDLQSAYHQVPILEEERQYTAFEAMGRLYQYKRLPFGVTNGASAFQRIIDKFIQRNNLPKVYAYLDDLTVTGATLEEHDHNLKLLLDAAERDGLTFNESKSKLRRETIQWLGYEIKHKAIKPDPDRLKPLLNMPPPTTIKELKRINGMFAYYAKWIKNFSTKANPLIKAANFPLNENALKSFVELKNELAKACLNSISDDIPFEIESDASDCAIAAILSQSGRPVAFMSRTLNSCEKNYPAIEKEATAIIEAVRKWSHFLKGRTFILTTDQRSVSFMFDKSNRGKIKNTKIMMWRLELSQYHYEIRHKPGKEMTAADTFSRICSSTNSQTQIRELHTELGHPGFARLYHFVRARNLPFTSEETKRACQTCEICAELKPQYYRVKGQTLIKATRSWERLAMDFKGPVKGPRPYLLVIIDEYSRYPFVFPCKNMSSETVIECLSTLFCMFGFPNFVHSDRGLSFVSKNVKRFLNERGIATSYSTPYHPQGNGQCERANQTIWRTVKLLLRSRQLQEDQWEKVLYKALHSVRSLLCKSTNQTPHERLFTFPRRAMTGTAMPTWLLSQGTKVLLRRFVRDKSDPLCDVVEILDANPTYARVRREDGRETTVSTSDLAPYPNITNEERNTVVQHDAEILPPFPMQTDVSSDDKKTSPTTETQPPVTSPYKRSSEGLSESDSLETSPTITLRRSERNRRPPERYGQWAI